MKNRALLVIDVQVGLFSKGNPVYQEEMLLENIIKLINLFREQNQEILFVQHENSGSLKAGLEGWQLHPQIKPTGNEPIFYKTQGSAFSNRMLREYLANNHIEEVVIVGLVTHGCIKATIKDARLLYQTVVIADAHSNFHEDGALMIDVWNKNWREEGLQVISTDEAIALFSKEE